MLTLEELKKLHEKAYLYSTDTRERAAHDMLFYWKTQWDDDFLNESQLGFRGEFNILRKAGRDIMADLSANPVRVDFDPKDEERTDGAEILDGIYRSTCRENSSIEAFNVGEHDSVVCGYGAWELYTDYESIRGENNNQVIRRRPIYEANNTCFFDPDAKLLDKSDSKYCSLLVGYSEDGYKDLYKELTGEETEVIPSNFDNPEQGSYSFSWISGSAEIIYVTRFYHKEKVKKKVFTLSDPMGEEITVWEDELDQVSDELIDAGYEISNEKEITRWQVTLYIASGEDILKSFVIAGEWIPVIPIYGERTMIDGEEHWEGITKLTKDPQMLRNFQMSYLADIVSRSPREKPIFYPEQIQGYENMYSISGAENNFPYLLTNRFAGDGSELPIGAVGTLPAPQVPPALSQSIELTRQAVEDVANPGLPQNIADPELSGKAVYAIQNQINKQAYVYQHNRKHAVRHDGVVFASMAAETYDVPRTVVLTKPDGTRKKVETMQTVIDNETGEFVTLHDIYNKEFDVFSDVSPSYNTIKEQTSSMINEMIVSLPDGDPLKAALIYKSISLISGDDFEDIRKYANRQSLISGFKQPENEEEMKIVQQAQQAGKEPSPEMVLAQAEQMKGQADVMREQRENTKLYIDMTNAAKKIGIEQFRAETERGNMQVNAEKVGADINFKRIDAFQKQTELEEKKVERELSS